MFLPRGPGALCSYRRAGIGQTFAYRFFATRSYEPLRILFCGSDEFSIASLKALHKEQLDRPDRISSIDVVCRPGKRVGRGLKKIREVPIKAAATDLSLPVHEIDTFKGWTPPILPGGPVNLIVAVSFGLFVPPRILNGAKYGGLNVHPSLLPDFRGPAPLHHTLLAGRTRTGVTLQTLDLKNFDHGIILQQTPPPGFEIQNPESCTVPDLLDIVAPKGAEILVDGIQKGLFVPPVEDAGWRLPEESESLIHAAKIKPEDRHINWANWTWLDISRRTRVLGPLWSKALVANDASADLPSLQYRRVIFTEIEEVKPMKGSEAYAIVPGLPFVDGAHPVEPRQGKGVYVFTQDGKLLRINQMKVEGEQNADALRAALKARMIGDRTFSSNGSDYTPFYNPLQ
ncbi:Methionyl-tRNA formyltransferase [Aspergillus alliaceus]|uniref:methionyl-tRNA formyltransferase n=1 Tax=Petromyces alliaceus TaxID=209559 RepID=A0A5N6FLH0_PETAA|nr:methionyl-tRNA formyltransferase family protein [Aspergillus alliaceus]KAB8230708.1 methionyl-tRNA formyltransferase family protein [Aspergillus alliaceus]KAE8388548.1 methionyl-tRNA formyltransferase family protein [Aspergillus alliaceus]KAF5865603.1 Methionyl-tRNA formyltransferase [Aspergillus burnettii]